MVTLSKYNILSCRRRHIAKTSVSYFEVLQKDHKTNNFYRLIIADKFVFNIYIELLL